MAKFISSEMNTAGLFLIAPIFHRRDSRCPGTILRSVPVLCRKLASNEGKYVRSTPADAQKPRMNHGRIGASHWTMSKGFANIKTAPVQTNTPANARHEYLPNALRNGSHPFKMPNFTSTGCRVPHPYRVLCGMGGNRKC